MSQAPKITVILTSYNHGDFIAKSIKSVLSQDYNNFELLILDDCSKDNSSAIIRSFNDTRIKFIQNEKNLGMVPTVNKGIKISDAKYIAHMNSDDIWIDNQKLSKQVEYLEANKNCGVVFTRVKMIDEQDNEITEKNKFNDERACNKTSNEWLNEFFVSGNRVCYPSAMVRKEASDKVGVYDARYSILLDVGMWARICLQYDIYIIDDICTSFRKGDNSYSNINRNYIDYEYSKVFENYTQLTYDRFLDIFDSELKLHFKELVGKINPKNYLAAFYILSLKYGRRHFMFAIPQLFNVIKTREFPEFNFTHKELREYSRKYMEKFFLGEQTQNQKK